MTYGFQETHVETHGHIKALVITVCSNDQGADLLQGWLLGLFSEV